jgi:hypothetical protein
MRKLRCARLSVSQPIPRPMWLTSIQHFVDGEPAKDRLHYECKVCEAKAVIPPMDV